MIVHAANVRRRLHELLNRLGLGDDPDAPREIAVVLAIRDGIPLRDALERLGIDTAPLDLPPPPQAVPFASIAPGQYFVWEAHVWMRATLEIALSATPDRRAKTRVVAAYLASIKQRRAATAFRWSTDASDSEPQCLAAYVDAEESVYPSAPIDTAAAVICSSSWIETADQSPAPGRTVTIDRPDGPITARILFDDTAAGGAAWYTATGDRLELDEVARWHL